MQAGPRPIGGYGSLRRGTPKKTATVQEQPRAQHSEKQYSADKKGDINKEEAGSRDAIKVEQAGGADQQAL